MKPLPVLENSTIDALQRGCASVSSINLGLSPKPSILTTSCLAENPRILAVALSTGSNLNSPVLVELDLGTEIARYSDTVKAQAFADSQETQASILLVLVAENAVVLTITLRPDDLSPSNVEVLDIKDLLHGEPAKSEVVSGAQLHKAMVAFYSKTCLVVALSPLLMAVNLDAGSAKVWLETRCLEEMKSRQSTIGTIFSKASDLILGKLEEGVVDMPPTAAVCVSSTANPLFDPTFVFSLHSDGSIKRWTVNDTSLLPLEVQSITPLDMPMPNPRDWSDLYNSVYLTARLYEQVYVLAAHIQYSGSRDYESEEVSNSNLFVIYGGQDSSVQATVMSSQTLIVPVEATLLVDMGFVPTLSCCSLMAMFRSTNRGQSGSGRVLSITYPPSLVSIVSSEPEIAPIDNFLDGVANAERARIEALAMSNLLESASSTNSYCLEDELHEVDSLFMKYLYRPAYPRGSGTVTPPLQHHIVNAIQKVVPGQINLNREEDCKSVELETLQAMHEWRTRENRKLLSASPTRKARNQQVSDPTPPLDELPVRDNEAVPSVYDSYVASALDIIENAELHDLDDDEEMSEADLHFSKDRTFLLEMHIKRWKRLLLAIWEEEQSLRSPLGLFLLDNSADEGCSRAVLMRSGFTSILADSNVQKKSIGILERLDVAAIKLITAIESDKMCFKKLFSMEQRIWHQTARAQLDSLTPSDFAEEYSRLVDFAFDAARGAAFTLQEQEQLEQSVSKITLEEYSEWLQATPENSDLPWLSLICGRSKPNQAGTGRELSSGRNQILNEQVRHAVCALSVRCLESGRRLLLGRYLLVSYLVRSTSRLSAVAFHLYERLLAVLWVGSQHVGTHKSFVKGDSTSASLAQLGDEPLKKTSSYCDIFGSIVSSSSSTTTCMDKLLISISQTRDSLTESESMGVVVSLGQEVFRSCLRSTVSTPDDVLSGKLARLMPELGALPPSSLQSVATDHPRFALRLIAPLVALSSAQDAPNVATARKDTLAECLLVESNKQTSVTVMSRMRVRACQLLASSSKVAPGNCREVGAAIETLKAANIGAPQLRQEDTENLCRNIQDILFGAEDEIRSETRRLVLLKSVKMLFTPLVEGAPEHLVADFDAAVKLLLPLFLCVSGLMHRVDILEHHFSKIRGSKDLVLDFIKSAIRELSDMFPLEYVESMPENLNLYNRLFDNAIAAKDFTLAYDVSLDNPSSERKFWNLENMVISMVDGGYLGELLDKCRSTAHSSTDCVDLYSIAVDALEDSSCHSSYLMRAHSEDSSTAASDFQGSLYALHVSRSQWRKAAQSLDLRFVNALHARGFGRTGKSQDSESAAVREKLVVADLVLASIGAENALSLVDDTSAQFIVSGEYGHNHPIQSSSDELSGIKRRRRPDASRDASEVEVSSFDRIRQVTGRFSKGELWFIVVHQIKL